MGKNIDIRTKYIEKFKFARLCMQIQMGKQETNHVALDGRRLVWIQYDLYYSPLPFVSFTAMLGK